MLIIVCIFCDLLFCSVIRTCKCTGEYPLNKYIGMLFLLVWVSFLFIFRTIQYEFLLEDSYWNI